MYADEEDEGDEPWGGGGMGGGMGGGDGGSKSARLPHQPRPPPAPSASGAKTGRRRGGAMRIKGSSKGPSSVKLPQIRGIFSRADALTLPRSPAWATPRQAEGPRKGREMLLAVERKQVDKDFGFLTRPLLAGGRRKAQQQAQQQAQQRLVPDSMEAPRQAMTEVEVDWNYTMAYHDALMNRQ